MQPDLIARIEAAQPSEARELFEEELRPCPFCGGEALAHFPKSDFAGNWIECRICRAKVTRYVKPKAAVAKWNTRATEASDAAELRELKERFSEAASLTLRMLTPYPLARDEAEDILIPFILPKPDPLAELAQEAFSAMLRANSPDGLTEALRDALAARGGKIVWGEDQ